MTEEQNIPTEETPTAATGANVTDTNGAAASTGAGELVALQERVAQLEREAAEYKDQWLRAAADYKNFKRRTEQERADLIRGASAGLVLKLLPVVDDLERAMGSATAEIQGSPWYNGFKLIPQKLQTVLESEGVTPIQALGQEFDPNFHEAVIYEAAGDGQGGKVVGELQKGYMLRERVLRPTMVKVGQG
ncbi:MAG: nucleotide exchange factor GrpE [Kouleothrix sp.]|jgi:molecular chaperone GrpE|nr:nucleotide exchange factor GrpE [Kouleothrix sp.]